jgi:hypothetical protein
MAAFTSQVFNAYIFFFIGAGLIGVLFREWLSLYMHSAMWARAELADEGCIHAFESFYLLGHLLHFGFWGQGSGSRCWRLEGSGFPFVQVRGFRNKCAVACSFPVLAWGSL